MDGTRLDEHEDCTRSDTTGESHLGLKSAKHRRPLWEPKEGLWEQTMTAVGTRDWEGCASARPGWLVGEVDRVAETSISFLEDCQDREGSVGHGHETSARDGTPPWAPPFWEQGTGVLSHHIPREGGDLIDDDRCPTGETW